MPNYCTNELIVKGSKESMERFYNVLIQNGDRTFTMEKFCPYPQEMYDPKNPDKLKSISSKPIMLKNGKEPILTLDFSDFDGDEFEEYLDIISKEVNDTWEMSNWGCTSDVCEQHEDQDCNEEKYCVRYWTPWGPNIKFVDFLFSKFPELSFTLDFILDDDPSAGIFIMNSEIKGVIQKNYFELYFTDSKETNKMVFITEYDYYHSRKEYKGIHYYSISLMHDEWLTVLAKQDITPDNIENWDELVEHLGNNIPIYLTLYSV